MPQKKVRKKFLVVLLLGLLSAIGPFSIDMYLPGFEVIAKDFGTSIAKVQLSLTSFFIGIAFGQLIYGPLLDRFGRKVPLVVGLLIYIAASVACAFSMTVDKLIFFRFVQALGSCAGMVAARTFVRDYFPPTETAKIFSLLMLVIGISPIVAPTTGGYLIHYFGWQYVFIVLGAITLLILFGVIFFLEDRRGADRTMSLLPKPIIGSFAEVLRLKQFYVFAISGGLASAGMYAYLSGSPFVMMELYGVNEKQYGWIFALLAGGLIIASQANSFVLRRFSSEGVSKVAVSCQAIVGLAMVSLTLLNVMNLTLIIILIFLYLACQGFVFPNTSALALNPFARLAGSASALLGTIQLALGAATSFFVSVFHDNSELPMVTIMAVCSVLSFVILIFGLLNITIKSNVA